MIDPVSGFPYPEAWVRLCTDEAARDLARSGFGVLTANGTVLRRGFTTGTTAAAAAFAAVASLAGAEVSEAEIVLPCGIPASVPACGRNGHGEAEKFAGEYPDDITAGILIVTEAKPSEMVLLVAGEGIGRFARATPRYGLGEPAISPQARAEILGAIAAAGCLAGVAGAEVVLRIPEGARIGALTLNPKVGVLGGISVVGTTGFVEPWDDHLTETLGERIAAASDVVITTGRTGLRFSRLLFPACEVVLAGSKIAEALAAAEHCRSVVVCGLPGLILRFFHPEVATSRGFSTVEELTASAGGPAAMRAEVLDAVRRFPRVRVVLLDRDGAVLVDSREVQG
ncbi:MAG: cobalt-precorrin-5B (C(1))-methyltransferase [Methanocorpusculum sp.]|nr:cobalt-precorrin-5B (C(1))-methyltransferase [Methanocorpusculum sp.]